jgi:archaellum component FlaG (FlaF/FlaG flagellin family)
MFQQGGRMSTLRRFTQAVVMAAVVAGVLSISAATVEAKPRGGDDAKQATCAYLLRVINYPNVSPYIKELAQQAYDLLGCGA